MRHIYSIAIIGLLIWIGITLNRIDFELANNWKDPSMFIGTLVCPVNEGGIINVNESIKEAP